MGKTAELGYYSTGGYGRIGVYIYLLSLLKILYIVWRGEGGGDVGPIYVQIHTHQYVVKTINFCQV